MADLRQSDLWAEYMDSIGWQIDKLQNHFIFTLELFRIRISKLPRFEKNLDIEKADLFFKDKGSLLLKLEPNFPVNNTKIPEIEKYGYQEDKWPLAPTKTIVIDLTAPLDTLLSNMEKDTRYSVRLGEKKGVVVKLTDNFEEFYTLYKQTATRNKFWTENKNQINNRWEIFNKNGKAHIFTAFHASIPLATAMVYYWEDTAYYLYAGSSGTKRELMAPYLLIWEIIKSAKKSGFERLDLEGIADPKYSVTNSWRGFSHFKKGFRGEELTSIGSFSKFRYKPINMLFRLANRSWD